MKLLQNIYKNNGIVILLLFVLLLLCSWWYCISEKGDLVLMFDQNRLNIINLFSLFVTQLAEPLLIVVICVALLLLNWKKGLFLSLALILNTIVVQSLKRVVFTEFKRPGFLLGDIIGEEFNGQFQVIEGMRLSVEHSFPSGHTMAGASLFFALLLMVQNSVFKVFLFVLIILVGLSRVYLAQHYFMDVFAGGYLAIILVVIYYILYNRTKLKFI